MLMFYEPNRDIILPHLSQLKASACAVNANAPLALSRIHLEQEEDKFMFGSQQLRNRYQFKSWINTLLFG